MQWLARLHQCWKDLTSRKQREAESDSYILSLSAAVFALALTALTATWIPARRASRIDPSIALRYE